jgi:hypothetical protein
LREEYKTACEKMMRVITERVIVTTRTAAQEVIPLLSKFRNPALIILFNAVMK